MQAKKVINYVESGDEDDDEEEETFKPPRRVTGTRGRTLKRRKTKEVSDEEDYAHNLDGAGDDIEEVDEGRPLSTVNSLAI